MSDDPIGDDAENLPPANVARLHPPRIPHHVTLDRAVQGQIGAQLRRMYEHYLDQPIPDRLLDLVGRLSAATESAEAMPPGSAEARQVGEPSSNEDEAR